VKHKVEMSANDLEKIQFISNAFFRNSEMRGKHCMCQKIKEGCAINGPPILHS
jgi:hypothetical protein